MSFVERPGRRAAPRGWRVRAAGGVLLCVALAGCGTLPASKRSLIVITLDTTRADHLGIYGGKNVPTPHLDRIAREGTVFDDAVSEVPLTLPSHSSIFTGRYPASHGVRHNGVYRLPASEVTLAERLHDAGFETAAFVAAFVLNRGFGIEQGFDTYEDVAADRWEGGEDRLFDAQRRAAKVNEGVFRWLDGRDRSRRFFLWVHYYDPHSPYDAPDLPGHELAGTGYDREISYMDACFGDLMKRLERDGLLDSSVVVVLGDHGEGLGDHLEQQHGFFLYQETVHVPLFIRAPGLVPAGRHIGGPVPLVDVAPTILDLLELPPFETAQGRSRLPEIHGKPPEGQQLAYAETLMGRIDFGWSELRMVRSERYKYIEAPKPELYDLSRDPGEKVNIVDDRPELSRDMASLLAEWEIATAKASSAGDATRSLSPEELARLQSLGYLGGNAGAAAPAPVTATDAVSRPDPKDMMVELARLGDARDRLNAGDAAGAVRILDGVLRDSPGNPVALERRAEALVHLGRLGEAEEEALRCIEANRKDPSISPQARDRGQWLLAWVYQHQGRLTEAEALYRQRVTDDPDNETAALDLASFLMEADRGAEAAGLVRELLERNPRNYVALAMRFTLEAQAGDEQAALETARTLADARSGVLPMIDSAASLLLKHDEPARAASLLEMAVEQRPEDTGFLGQLGTAQLRAGRPGDAKQTFLAFLRVAPRDPRPQYSLGLIALDAGDEKEARFRFQQALRLDARFNLPLLSLARWLEARGRHEEAVEAVRQAIERNPADGLARETLNDLTRPRGRPAQQPAPQPGPP